MRVCRAYHEGGIPMTVHELQEKILKLKKVEILNRLQLLKRRLKMYLLVTISG